MIHRAFLSSVLPMLLWSWIHRRNLAGATVPATVFAEAFVTLKARTAVTTASRNDGRFKNVSGLVATTQEDDNKRTLSSLDEQLYGIARRLKLEVLDLDEGIYGYESQDNRYGLEVVHSTILDRTGDGLGFELTEVAASTSGDGRGLVLIGDIFAAAAQATDQLLQVGDVLTGISVEGTDFRERLTALDYDSTIETIGRGKQAAARAVDEGRGTGAIRFEADRMVERAPITVEVTETKEDGSTTVRSVDALAGENLRRLLQRKDIKIYNLKTKRFDMPFSTGDCAGEGLCGTCLVRVEEGMDILSPRDPLEGMVTKGRPLSWRASCRTVVGHDNKPGKVRIHTQPQNKFRTEVDRGVQSILPED